MEELNTLLSTLASEGRHHSDGEFTITLEHAIDKLSAYRLVDPTFFVLNLVAAAVTSRASTFTVNTGNNGLSIYYNRFPDEPEALQGLFTYILDTEAPPHLRELALAVHGAQSLPDNPELSLLLGGDGKSWRARIQGKSVSLEPDFASEIRRGIQMFLTYPSRPAWATLFGGSGGSVGKILERMFHFCRYAPLVITLNGCSKGSAVNLAVHDEGVMAWCHRKGRQELRVSRPGRRPNLYVSLRSDSPVDSSIALTLTTPEVASRTGLLIISRGVVFHRPNHLLGCNLACGVVTADHLEKNLSQSDLTEGPEYRALLQAAQREVDHLLLEMCEDPPLLNALQRSSFESALRSRFKGSELPSQVEMYYRLSTLDQDCNNPRKLAEHVRFVKESIEDQGLQNRFRKELTQAIEMRAGESFAQQQWAWGAGYLPHLQELGAKDHDDLRIVALLLSNQREQAEKLYQNNPEVLSPTLALLCEVTPEVDSNSVPTKFARLERALWNSDRALARQLADELESASDTVFLTLYLGGFWAYERDMKRASAMWERALAAMTTVESEFWWSKLWGLLRGKLPFMLEVRWQARNAFRSLRAGQNAPRSYDCQALLLEWVMLLWHQRASAGPEEAKEVFLSNYLPALIEPKRLKLVNPTSPNVSVALPSS